MQKNDWGLTCIRWGSGLEGMGMEGEEDEWYEIMDNKWISRMDISLQEMDIEGTAGLPGLVFIMAL